MSETHPAAAPPPGIVVPLDPAGRARAIARVLLLTLGLNLAAAAVKLTAAWQSGSLALGAGGFDSLFDGAANVFGLVAIRFAARPPDADHPYGHRKFETLVATVIAMLLFVTCGRLAWAAVEAVPAILAGTGGAVVTPLALVSPAAAFAFNVVAATYEGRMGRRLGSELLVSDAGHTRADAGVSLALVGGLLAVRAGYPIVDPLLSLAIAGVIARTGIEIARSTSQVLSDAAVFEPAVVAGIAARVPGVAGTHKIRSRGPADAASIDLHVQVDPALDIGRAHAIGHAVAAELRTTLAGVADVVVHVEPDWSTAGTGTDRGWGDEDAVDDETMDR